MLRNNTQRAKNATILLWIILALELLLIWSSYLQLDLLQRFQDGINISEAEIGNNDIREAFIGLLYMVVYIASAVTFIQWFRRAYYNLHLIDSRNLSHSEGWAAGCWFVPILNLYRPYQIMKELYIETTRLLVNGIADYKKKNHGLLVELWWGLWFFVGVVGNMVTRLSFMDQNLEDIIFLSQLSILLSILSIPLTLLAIRVVKSYADLEQELFSLYRDADHLGNGNNSFGDAYDQEDILDIPLE